MRNIFELPKHVHVIVVCRKCVIDWYQSVTCSALATWDGY